MRYLDSVPRIDPAAVDTVLEMVGAKGAPRDRLYDNTIIDRLIHEGFTDKLYKGAKPCSSRSTTATLPMSGQCRR